MSQGSAPSAATTSNGQPFSSPASSPMLARYLASPSELPDRLVYIAETSPSTSQITASRLAQTRQGAAAWDARWIRAAGQST
ncbi:hypothetical protein CPLU01_01890 [Colletotrichum plurivorum]|uniref:Uncharacterized protein n=1 Tax=Colletotrichum plurivorum TaxID=2175906 RepID=A0A8H6KXN5_9PEZI|nr:hypothetical protein CPLU01_01890 [Colletotrichum plurivorum]